MKKLGFDIVLLGDPTAGKDTQALFLMKKYYLKPIESGKYWRKMAHKKNAEGSLIRRTMSIGAPAPVFLMKKFLEVNTRRIPKNMNLLFIGNPKLKPEGQLLNKLLNQKKRDFIVFYIQIPVSEIIKRTKIRSRLKSEDIKVQKRIKWHKIQMGKTIKYFQSLGKLKKINGNQPISKVTKDILKEIENYKKKLEN